MVDKIKEKSSKLREEIQSLKTRYQQLAASGATVHAFNSTAGSAERCLDLYEEHKDEQYYKDALKKYGDMAMIIGWAISYEYDS